MHAIAAMGFDRIPVDGPLTAEFHALHVFSVRGFTCDDMALVTKLGSTAGTSYAIGCGASLNAVCEDLLGHQFARDEAEWANSYRAKSPYLVVHIGPTSAHTVSDGFVKTSEGDDLISYDAFGPARNELSNLEELILPAVETALGLAFAATSAPAIVVPVDVARFGLTPGNIVVHDFRLSVSATAYVSRRLGSAQIDVALETVTKLGDSVNKRFATFFQLGRRDDDELKRFLYFFLALEVETHRVFGSMSKSEHLQNAALFDGRVGAAAAELLEKKQENWVNLADRFVWCVASVWTHLTIDDVYEFKRLKKIRDDIAHGNIAKPPTGGAEAAEALAIKVHRPLAMRA